MNILLVRHGQTDWNVKDLLQGQTDIELNETGRKQAKETANLLKEIKIDAIYSSPLKRTQKTAEEINKNRNLKIILDSRLIERGFGGYEGRSKVEFKRYWKFESNEFDGNVEPIQTLFKRVYFFLKELENLYKNTNKTIVIVTHNGTNLAITSILNGLKDNIFEYNLKPCEYRIFKNISLKSWEEFNGKYKI